MRFNFAIVFSSMFALLPQVFALHDHYGRVQMWIQARSATIQGTGETNFDEEVVSTNTSTNQSPQLQKSSALPKNIFTPPARRDIDNQNRTRLPVLVQIPQQAKQYGETAEHNQTQVPILVQVEQKDETQPPQDKTREPGKNKIVLAILEVLGLGFFWY